MTRLHPDDIEAIAQRVAALLQPMLSPVEVTGDSEDDLPVEEVMRIKQIAREAMRGSRRKS